MTTLQIPQVSPSPIHLSFSSNKPTTPQVSPSQIHLSFSSNKPTTKLLYRQSRLNPLRRLSGSPQLSLNTITNNKPLESIQTHISNLDKVLQRQPSLASTLSSNGVNEEDVFRLSKVLPGIKSAEEMAPRSLNSLKRLLSISQEYSPRNNLASRWREYHGCYNWEKLLDPLDDNLRHEVVKYGEFVQAAYHAIQSKPATTCTSGSDASTSYPSHVALPDRSYKVTKSLYATSSISLPSWIDKVTPRLSWLTQRSSWVGYVAVCDDRREIARMGRRDIVISLRGTSTCLEWAENVKNHLVEIPEEEGPSHPKVECGFLSLYKTPGSNPEMASLSESIVNEIRRLIDEYKGETLSISITGHSLGAALAVLAADELSTCGIHMPPIAVYSFGGPRVGNKAFANRITNNGVKVLRVVNSQDVVTRVPGMFVNETLDEKLRSTKVVGLLQVLDDNVYSHVGSELRVDTKMSPYLKPNADYSCCHDLEAYLHLVDGFRSSYCPFRANAKRSLAKLLQEQGSNMKKLYTSKALSLKLAMDRRNSFIPKVSPSKSFAV